MQNERSNHKFLKFCKDKGYYMVLALCAVAIVVAGVVFLTDMGAEKQALEQTLSTPVTAPLPQQEVPAAQETAEVPAEEQLPVSAEPEQPVSRAEENTVRPVSGAVVQDHAMDRLVYNATTRDWRVHNGVDLSAPLGQEVRAARGGTVTAVYEDDAYGITVQVTHDGGWVSKYCGLAETLSVETGEAVQAGQILGTVGTTALVEVGQEPHLHFEVFRNNQPMDPADFLQ